MPSNDPPTLTVPPPHKLPPLSSVTPNRHWPSLSRVVHGETPLFATRFCIRQTADHVVVDYVAKAASLRTRFEQANAPLYEDDVLEVFLQPPQRSPAKATRYLELEVSPAGVLFDAWISNRTNLDDPTAARRLDVQLNPPGTGRPQATVLLDGQPPSTYPPGALLTGVRCQEWKARLEIPFTTLLNPPYPAITPPDQASRATYQRPLSSDWKVNVFRVQHLDSQPDRQTEDREYTAWSPTGLLDFHRPDRFGTLLGLRI